MKKTNKLISLALGSVGFVSALVGPTQDANAQETTQTITVGCYKGEPTSISMNLSTKEEKKRLDISPFNPEDGRQPGRLYYQTPGAIIKSDRDTFDQSSKAEQKRFIELYSLFTQHAQKTCQKLNGAFKPHGESIVEFGKQALTEKLHPTALPIIDELTGSKPLVKIQIN